MDVSFLQPVFAATGPFATVCVDVTRTTENAAAELDLRVRAAAEALAEQGAPEVVVDAVRGSLLEADAGGEVAPLKGRALVVAADGTVVLDEVLGDVPGDAVASWSPQPDLLPVLRQMAARVPHAVVIADRVGADISVAAVAGRPEEEREVEGDTFRLRKVKVGGWKHNHYMRTVENRWEENAGLVADELASLVRRLSLRFVLIAGDVRARQVLTDSATGVWEDLVVTMDEGGRAAGADREVVQQRAAELVAEHEAHEQAGAVEKIASAGARGLAVTGLAAVVETLRKGQVETLVLADDPADEQLLVGDDPTSLGVQQGDMDALGTHGTAVPADRALLAAAVAGAAGAVVVPRAAMPEGVGVAAILRYTDDSTPSAEPART